MSLQPNQVHYRYLAEQELTEAESPIHRELPSNLEQDDIVILFIEKKKLEASSYQVLGIKN